LGKLSAGLSATAEVWVNYRQGFQPLPKFLVNYRQGFSTTAEVWVNYRQGFQPLPKLLPKFLISKKKGFKNFS
jgi:hypothetical protein